MVRYEGPSKVIPSWQRKVTTACKVVFWPSNHPLGKIPGEPQLISVRRSWWYVVCMPHSLIFLAHRRHRSLMKVQVGSRKSKTSFVFVWEPSKSKGIEIHESRGSLFLISIEWSEWGFLKGRIHFICLPIVSMINPVLLLLPWFWKKSPPGCVCVCRVRKTLFPATAHSRSASSKSKLFWQLC